MNELSLTAKDWLSCLPGQIKTIALDEVVQHWPEVSHVAFPLRSHPLFLAACVGRVDLVEFFLPFASDEDKHSSYEVSAQRMHLGVLKKIVRHVDPNCNNGQALQWAMYNKDYPMIDFLLDLVNPKDALDMMKPAWGDTREWMYVNDVVRATASAKRLNKALKKVSPSLKQKKM